MIRVNGELFTQLPPDLYIPPEALEVILENFEGPLDLLLYLIKKQNLDILNIPVALISKQYMAYIQLMKNMHFELAADYLVMAAMLAEIKSQLLLPRKAVDIDEEDDPRAELVRRLLEYERFKKAAENLEQLPRCDRDIVVVNEKSDDALPEVIYETVSLDTLVSVFQDILARQHHRADHHIRREELTVADRIEHILHIMRQHTSMSFQQCLRWQEGRKGVVVTFMALLELLKQSMIELIQEISFGPISIRSCLNGG